MKSRKLKTVLSLVLTIALLVGNIGLLMPKLTAEAASGSYTVTINYSVGNKADSQSNIQTSYIKVNYTTNNGTGSSGSTTYSLYDNWSYCLGSTGSKTITITSAGFPTSIYIDHDATWNDIVTYTISSITVSGPSKTVTAWSGSQEVKSGGWGNSEFTKTLTLSAETPKLSTFTISSVASVKIPSSGSTTAKYTVTATDQYGVAWSDPTAWSSNHVNTSITGSGKTGTVTFTTNTLDYTTTVKATCKNESGTSKTVSTSTTAYVLHTITVNPNGGTYNNTTANTTYTKYTNDTQIIANPTRTGYTFGGWTITATAGTASTLSGTTLTVKNGNSTLTANWTPNDYTLSFDANGGSVDPADKTVTYDAAIGELPVPTRIGYDFAGWYTAQDGGEAVSAETVYTTADNSTVYAHWTPNNDSVIADKTAIDFGLPVVIDVLGNDILQSDAMDASVVGIGAIPSDPTDTLDTSVYQSEYVSSSGTFTIGVDNTVTYTPDGFLSEPQTAYVAVSAGGKYVYSKITVVPATVIYYEDDANSLISYRDGASADGSTGTWGTVGDSRTSSVTQNLSDDVYGYDVIYADAANSTYSMGSSHIVSVSAKNNPNSQYSGSDGNSWPTAQFTFAGTGFDIVSLTDHTTGTIEVRVYSGTEASGKPIYDWIVDTYYGYELQNGEWVVSENSGTLYQIPVISTSSLSYGTYTVQIIPMYSSRLDHAKNGSYDFYLDAVRIYNPCGDNQDANDIYLEDGEMIAADYELRELLLSADSLGDEADTGAVYLNPSLPDGTLEDYKKAGPKNEVYLDKGQAVAFGLTASSIPDRVLISAHAPTGTAASLRFGDGSGSYTDAVTIATATTLYYEIPVSASDWEQNADGNYTTKQPILIANGGDSILSLCRIKCTYAGSSTTAEGTAVLLTMTRSSALRASAVAGTMSTLSAKDTGLFVPETVTAEEMTEALVSGDSIEITITTTDDVDRLTVNGKDAVCTETADGTKTWTFTYTADETGEQTLELVAYDEYGYASESTTMTVTVESKAEHFFHNLAKFIKAILELIRTIAKAVEF